MCADNLRPDPEILLKHVIEEENRRNRGRLSVFLGYAAGVGKTYAMLTAAHQRKAEGIDVVVGYIETHKRLETEALLDGLERIPAHELHYKGVSLAEVDLDAILARRPQLVLVDELAHTNAVGSRHAKRFQDVEELLLAGINVFTTLNIQHLQSLNDVVYQITGVQVQETLPDRILDEADEIKLVDLPPEELQQRFREGKVYVAGQADRALDNFFRLGNLNALRELALRRTAERVGEQMRTYMETHAIPGPWHAEERVLVCIGPTPTAERLVRSARRLADELHGDLLGIHVETGQHNRLDEASQEAIRKSLQLAEELGAKTTVLPGGSVAESILSFASRHNITKIVVGKTKRSVWQDRWQVSLVDYLIRNSGNVDVYVVSGDGGTGFPKFNPLPRSQNLVDYLQATVLIGLVTVGGISLRTLVEPTNLVMLFLAATLFAALRWGRGPSLLATVLGVLCFDYFMVLPYHTFAVEDVQYLVTFVALLAAGFLTSGLAAKARDQAEVAQRRTLLTTELYDFTRDLASATTLDELLAHIAKHIRQTLDGDVAIFLPKGEHIDLHLSSATFQPSPEEQAVAFWVFQHHAPAGNGTRTLAGAEGRYLPLKASDTIVGVLGVLIPSVQELLPEELTDMLAAFCTQAAVAIEHFYLQEQAMRLEVMAETEKLQAALLDSISHDLRTPLVSITGALTTFQENDNLKGLERDELLKTALGEANRLNRLVGNLLDMTRLEGGALSPRPQRVDIREIIEFALEEHRERLGNRKVNLNIPAHTPFVKVDPTLIGRAVGNIMDNAIKYSSPESSIDISVTLNGASVVLEISDRGPGIPEGEQALVFDKFYRVNRPNQKGGTGLGLSISKGLIEANNGKIEIASRQGGGLRVLIALPNGEN